MFEFAANLGMLFAEVPFLERFERTASAGFEGVESPFPYEYPPQELAARLERHGLEQVLFNLPPGDYARGERGLGCLPDRVGEFQDGVGRALEYAAVLGCRQITASRGPRAGAIARAWSRP